MIRGGEGGALHLLLQVEQPSADILDRDEKMIHEMEVQEQKVGFQRWKVVVVLVLVVAAVHRALFLLLVFSESHANSVRAA